MPPKSWRSRIKIIGTVGSDGKVRPLTPKRRNLRIRTVPAAQASSRRSYSTLSAAQRRSVFNKFYGIRRSYSKPAAEPYASYTFMSPFQFYLTTLLPDKQVYPRSGLAMVNLPHLLFGNPRWTDIQNNYEECYLAGVEVSMQASFGMFSQSNPGEIKPVSFGTEGGVPVLSYHLDTNGPYNIIDQVLNLKYAFSDTNNNTNGNSGWANFMNVSVPYGVAYSNVFNNVCWAQSQHLGPCYVPLCFLLPQSNFMKNYVGNGQSSYAFDMQQWIDPVRMHFRQIRPRGFNHVGFRSVYWNYQRTSTEKTFTTIMHGSTVRAPTTNIADDATIFQPSPFIDGYQMFPLDPTNFDNYTFEVFDNEPTDGRISVPFAVNTKNWASIKSMQSMSTEA